MPITVREVVFPDTFNAFLRKNLTADEFNNPIFTKLGWTRHRLTRFCNTPEQMRFKDVLDLSVFLFGDRKKSYLLVERYNCGVSRITLAEKEVIDTYRSQQTC